MYGTKCNMHYMYLEHDKSDCKKLWRTIFLIFRSKNVETGTEFVMNMKWIVMPAGEQRRSEKRTSINTVKKRYLLAQSSSFQCSERESPLVEPGEAGTLTIAWAVSSCCLWGLAFVVLCPRIHSHICWINKFEFSKTVKNTVWSILTSFDFTSSGYEMIDGGVQ